MRARRLLLRAGLAVAALLVLAQFLPFGRVENPPVRAEPAWDSPRTRELAVRACFDCHSNQSDRKSTRLNSSHSQISYAVFCLKKKKQSHIHDPPITTTPR